MCERKSTVRQFLQILYSVRFTPINGSNHLFLDEPMFIYDKCFGYTCNPVTLTNIASRVKKGS